MTTPHEELNSLDNWNLIAGGTWYINLEVRKESDLTLLDMTGGSAYFRMSPLGDPEATVLDLEGTITGVGLVEWDISSSETIDLQGIYTFQFIITDFQGDEFIPGQGKAVILPQNASLI